MSVASPLRRGARQRLADLDRLLEASYRTPETDLGNKSDPLDEAVYVVLSFQTDLARFASTWARLKAAYPSWELMEQASAARIARILREGGLQRQKARTLKQLFAAVRKVAGSLSLDVLRQMDTESAERTLLWLPGLSWKGARCVLLYSLGQEVLPVDSNTFRILKRVGVLRHDAVYRRRLMHDSLQNLVPPDRRRALHVNLVVHGQRTCLPVAPKCDNCVARSACAMSGVPRRIRQLTDGQRLTTDGRVHRADLELAR
jgi:endonuclease III